MKSTLMHDQSATQVWQVWDASWNKDHPEYRLEMPCLARFKGHWYCAFREAVIHNNHPSGRVRLIRSENGSDWHTVKIFDWDCADVREAKIAVTGDGQLMISSSVYFVSREPREVSLAEKADRLSFTPSHGRTKMDMPGLYYQLDWLGTVLNLPDNDAESQVAQQTVSWLSQDGLTWSSAYASDAGINSWLWGVTWHNGMGYSLAQWGKDSNATLYRTRDGKSWSELVRDIGPQGRCNEGALAFTPENTLLCLMRDGQENVMLGTSPGPYYQTWKWNTLEIDYGPNSDGLGPARDVLGTSLGGPVMIRMKNGRYLAAGRALGPGRTDGKVTLFYVDPDEMKLTWITEFNGTSYPGLVEHDDCVWVTYVGHECHNREWRIYMSKVILK